MSKRRRDPNEMGDATRQRIKDLADGWSVPNATGPTSAAPDVAIGADVPTRPKRTTAPPPLPPPHISAPPPINDTIPTPKQALSIEASTDSDSDEDATIAQLGGAFAFATQSEGAAAEGAAARVRQRPTLPRKRGVAGDVRYVFTALFGVTGARRELAEVNTQIAIERDARDLQLLQVTRDMIADADVKVAVVDHAREQLSDIEELRSRKAGAAAASEAELESLARNRQSEQEEAATQVGQRESERKQIANKLAPLEKSAATTRRKAAKLHAALEQIDEAIATKKSSMVTVKGPKQDPATIEADIASLRAERAEIGREEPAIAAELDELEPTLASLKVASKEAGAEIDRLNTAEAEAKLRNQEKLAAVRAVKAVQDRAVAETSRERDDALRALGEQLCLDRPETVVSRLTIVDDHDVKLATLERQAVELTELVNGVDGGAVMRGVAVMVAATAVFSTLLWLIAA